MKKRNVLQRSWLLLALVTLACGLFAAPAFAVDPLIVRVQPSGDTFATAYVVTGEARTYFGMVEGGTAPYEYKWEFTAGAGDTGFLSVGDPRYISYDGKVFDTAGTGFARLSVRDSGTPQQTAAATINLQVIAVASDTLNRQKNSAVDRGLRYLYQVESPNPAGAGSQWPGSGAPIGSTGMALVAMENHAHNLQSPDSDIYKKSVKEGIRFLLNNAAQVSINSQPCIGDPDSNHNGFGVSFNGGQMYQEGIAGLALANSCDKATAQSTPAVTTNALNGQTLWNIMVDAQDYLAWAQGDGNSGTGNNSANSSDGTSLMYWNITSATLNIYQGYVYLPNISAVACGGTYTVNWGDGTSSSFSSETGYCPYGSDGYPTFGWFGAGGASHTYTTPGTYTATISYTDGVTTLPFSSGTPITITTGSAAACGPTEASHGAGGWRYGANYSDSDNSVTQWPALALAEAKNRWGITPNPLMVQMLDYWLAYSQGSTSGGFGYTSPGNWENFPKTGAGVIMLNYIGLPIGDSRVQNALSFLNGWWDYTGGDGNLGNMYSMYAFYKGMKAWGLGDLAGRPWEQLYTQYLVSSQGGSGEWYDGGGWEDQNFATFSALAILAPEVASLPPVANAGGPYPPVNAGQTTTLNGGSSYHQDPAKSIVKWEWDFNAADGLWWDTKLAPAPGEGAVGITAGVSYPDIGADATYTVTLRVSDNSTPIPMTDTDTATVTVTSGEVAPVAKTNGPWTGLPSTAILFDGTASYDPNACTTPGNPSCLGDHIVKYEWDLNGNGIFNEPGVDGDPVVPGDYSKVTKSFATPISLPAKLRVTDSYGLTGESTDALNVVSIAVVYGSNYGICFRQTLDRYRERQGLRITFKNQGTAAAENAKMTVTQLPSNLSVTNNKSFSVLGTMLAGESKVTACNPTEKTADIEVIFDRRIPKANDWRWRSEFDYNGVHYTVDNIPALGP